MATDFKPTYKLYDIEEDRMDMMTEEEIKTYDKLHHIYMESESILSKEDLFDSMAKAFIVYMRNHA